MNFKNIKTVNTKDFIIPIVNTNLKNLVQKDNLSNVKPSNSEIIITSLKNKQNSHQDSDEVSNENSLNQKLTTDTTINKKRTIKTIDDYVEPAAKEARIKINILTPSSSKQFEKPSDYKINDSAKKMIDEMKMIFENESSTHHSLLKIEKHLEKNTKAFEEISKSMNSMTNVLKDLVNKPTSKSCPRYQCCCDNRRETCQNNDRSFSISFSQESDTSILTSNKENSVVQARDRLGLLNDQMINRFLQKSTSASDFASILFRFLFKYEDLKGKNVYGRVFKKDLERKNELDSAVIYSIQQFVSQKYPESSWAKCVIQLNQIIRRSKSNQ